MFHSSRLGLAQASYSLRRKPLVDYSSGKKNRATIVESVFESEQKKSPKPKKMARRKRKVGRPRKKRALPGVKKKRPTKKRPTRKRPTRRRSTKKRVRVNRGRLVMNVPGYGVQRIPTANVLRQVPIGLIRKLAKKIASQSAKPKRGRKRTKK